MENFIKIKNAKEHNLKIINLNIPKNKLIVITGVSGSGKSSLAFDVIHNESQRKYIENLSPNTKRFIELHNKANVESISGLSPSIAVSQKLSTKNPRSTIGTMTEIYDYLRLLFTRIGIPYSPVTGNPITMHTISEIINNISQLPQGMKINILSPIARNQKGNFRKELLTCKKNNFNKVIIDGKVILLDQIPNLSKDKEHNIEIIVDEITISKKLDSRLENSIKQALKLSNKIIYIKILETSCKTHQYRAGEKLVFAEKYVCPFSNFELTTIDPRLFSFNIPSGACERCLGIGEERVFNKKLIIDDHLSIMQGAIKPLAKNNNHVVKQFYKFLEAVADHYNFSLAEIFEKLPDKIQDIIIYGSEDELIKIISHENNSTNITEKTFPGVISFLNTLYKSANSIWPDILDKYLSNTTCKLCNGFRLRKEALCIKINNMNIGEVSNMNIDNLYNWIANVETKIVKKYFFVAEKIIYEIKKKLGYLINIGLYYLQLSRKSTTLSGGEIQRIRLASQIGSELSGITYIFDEPSIGLHINDNKKLINSLKFLKNLGNTVIVIEHNMEIIKDADYIIEIGPKSGMYGGEIIACGTIKDIINNKNSITGSYLTGAKFIPTKNSFRNNNSNLIELLGITHNNLSNVDLKIPLNNFIAITGVSGSGKSSLLEVLYNAVFHKIKTRSKSFIKNFTNLKGAENVHRIANVSQSPIGRTPRSNPATYIGVFLDIRELFTSLPDAVMLSYKSSMFSFNVKGGRCEECKGDGIIKVDMHFLQDIYITCDMCNGKRYNQNALNIKYNKKSIYDILEMTVDEAAAFFKSSSDTCSKSRVIYNKIKVLSDIGLGYLKVGQPAPTLSGGEAQRIKIAKELLNFTKEKTLYILDEPTIGLHAEDIILLLDILQKLVNMGNTVIIIEHNIDVIKVADYVIDVGPGCGDFGGKIIAQGDLDNIIKCKESLTGKALKEYLNL